MTTPATETKSIGLPADAQAVKVFAAQLTILTVTRHISTIYLDWQKPRQPRRGRQLTVPPGR
jgi:hypothetical protein